MAPDSRVLVRWPSRKRKIIRRRGKGRWNQMKIDWPKQSTLNYQCADTKRNPEIALAIKAWCVAVICSPSRQNSGNHNYNKNTWSHNDVNSRTAIVQVLHLQHAMRSLVSLRSYNLANWWLAVSVSCPLPTYFFCLEYFLGFRVSADIFPSCYTSICSTISYSSAGKHFSNTLASSARCRI